MGKPKILIVCYTFPPYNGIGGRRWAKFAKYLNLNGFNVHIIAANQPIPQNSDWISDVESLKSNISFLPTNYPKWLIIPSNSLYAKIRYKWSIFFEKNFTKGNIFDRSKHWENNLQKAIILKLKEGFNTVIYSTPPFRGAYFIAKLKEKYNFNFILDYRDPWTNNKTGFGFETQKSKVLDYEKSIEKYTIQKVDGMLSVLPEYIEYVQTSYNVSIPKTLVLPNGFDSSDFNNISNLEPSQICRLVFTGTLYFKAMHVFTEFVEAIKNIQKTNVQAYNKLQIDFYGNVQPEFNSLTKNLNVIKYHGIIPNQQVFKEISKANACLLFLADDTNNTFSTKFHEYVQFKKPILVCSKAGKTGKYVKSNKIGYAVEQGNMENTILKVIENFENNTLSFNTNYSNFETQIPNLTKQLIQFLHV